MFYRVLIVVTSSDGVRGEIHGHFFAKYDVQNYPIPTVIHRFSAVTDRLHIPTPERSDNLDETSHAS
jgi:hypothetical protein